jgi:hypothetical protein
MHWHNAFGIIVELITPYGQGRIIAVMLCTCTSIMTTGIEKTVFILRGSYSRAGWSI